MALTLAECLTDIALAGKRLLNLAQKEMVKDALQRNPGVDPSEISVESNYRENMKRLRNAVKTLLMELAVLLSPCLSFSKNPMYLNPVWMVWQWKRQRPRPP